MKMYAYTKKKDTEPLPEGARAAVKFGVDAAKTIAGGVKAVEDYREQRRQAKITKVPTTGTESPIPGERYRYDKSRPFGQRITTERPDYGPAKPRPKPTLKARPDIKAAADNTDTARRK